jgi:hypothetical protein
MTTETQTPEDWVLTEAAKQSGYGEAFCEPKWLRYNYNVLGKAFHALCDMIAKHEKPPVDRKLLCAREAAARGSSLLSSVDQFLKGELDKWGAVKNSVLAIELYEEGFGK